MANYNSLKNAALIAPTTNPDLGSATNRYGNVFLSGNVNIAGTSLTSTNAVGPRISGIGYLGDDTAADIAGGQTITVNGAGFVTGATIYLAGASLSVVTTVSSSQLSFISPIKSAGSYSLSIVNPDGATATFVPGIQYSGTPAWTTAAGSLGNVSQSGSVSITLAATGDAPVTYSLNSGALPSGVTLNTATGVLSGTAPAPSSDTTYNFNIRATDLQKQDTDRSFSLIVLGPVPILVEYLVVAGGGGGGSNSYGQGAGGGGAGGYRTATGFLVTKGSPLTVTVGAGGTGAGIAQYPTGAFSTSGNFSNFDTIQCFYGGSGASTGNGGIGGSGGGGANNGTAGPTFNTTPSQGNPGATGSGGGGGAGSAASGGTGGTGATSSISGSSVTYATGGNSTGAAAGANGTGNGGGGGGSGTPGGKGGDGIVIIRYANTHPAATATTGDPTITVAGGYRVYKFTSSGSITF